MRRTNQAGEKKRLLSHWCGLLPVVTEPEINELFNYQMISITKPLQCQLTAWQVILFRVVMMLLCQSDSLLQDGVTILMGINLTVQSNANHCLC